VKAPVASLEEHCLRPLPVSIDSSLRFSGLFKILISLVPSRRVFSSPLQNSGELLCALFFPLDTADFEILFFPGHKDLGVLLSGSNFSAVFLLPSVA